YGRDRGGAPSNFQIKQCPSQNNYRHYHQSHQQYIITNNSVSNKQESNVLRDLSSSCFEQSTSFLNQTQQATTPLSSIPSGFGQNNSEYEMTIQPGFAASQAAIAATTTLLYKSQHRQNDIDKHQSNNQNHESNSNSSSTGLNQKKLLELYELGLHDDEPYLKPIIDFKLDTPEAIAKWIEDRKRNYPTDANIARKQQVEAEKISRGLVIKADKNGLKRKLKQDDDYSKRKISRHEIDEFGGPCGITDLVIAAEAAGTTLDLDNPTNFIPAYKPTYKNKKDSESTNIIERFYSNICIKYRPGHCPRGKKCGNRHRGIMICPPLQRPPDHQRIRQRNLREMLLYKEKSQEKNAILQCLRYIVDANFFGVVTNDSLKNAKGPLIE
ncbi:9645_t:CDS:2, partial [Dentiscutata erythropus]